MNIDTLSLHAFIAVAETNSFTQAGLIVGRTQSAISQQITKLELQIGKALFARGKKLTLTPDGEIFLSYAKRIFALHKETIDHFKQPDLEGEVRFGLPEDFASAFLSDVLVAFARIHPRVMLNIECDLTLNLFERFKQQEFDLVLIKMHRPENFPNGLDIWSEKLEWVGDINLVHLHKSIPLVLSPQPCIYRLRAINALNNMHRKWHIVFSSQSYASTLAAVKAGLGITVLPNKMIPESLHAIRTQHLPLLEDTHVSLIKHQHNNSAINSFEEFVVKKLRH
ncbi:MAG: LysR substrate-binding domain-containing protein [Gammaproteobacteria bacterium]